MNDEFMQITSLNGRITDTGYRISIIAFVNVLLRYRYLIVGVPLVLTALVTALVLRQPVRFTASTRFVPQGFDVNANVSGLAAQFGLRMGGANPSESPAFYAELLHSRQILAEAVLTRYSRADGRTA